MVASVGSIQHGDTAARLVSSRIGGTVANRTALKAIPPRFREDGQVFFSASNRSMWMFIAGDTRTEDTNREFIITPDVGTGAYIRIDKAFVAKLAFDFNTADAAILETVPEGFSVRLAGMPFWECTVAFSGGASSAIGISSSTVTGYTTKGDLLGGAAGDVAAGLGAGTNAGTIGPKVDTLTELQALLIEEGTTFRFDRITSAFTAGSGFACFPLIVDPAAPATP